MMDGRRSFELIDAFHARGSDFSDSPERFIASVMSTEIVIDAFEVIDIEPY